MPPKRLQTSPGSGSKPCPNSGHHHHHYHHHTFHGNGQGRTSPDLSASRLKMTSPSKSTKPRPSENSNCEILDGVLQCSSNGEDGDAEASWFKVQENMLFQQSSSSSPNPEKELLNANGSVRNKNNKKSPAKSEEEPGCNLSDLELPKKVSFRTYCEETSLHGWKYVAISSSTTCEKICWLILLIGSLTTASVLVYR